MRSKYATSVVCRHPTIQLLWNKNKFFCHQVEHVDFGFTETVRLCQLRPIELGTFVHSFPYRFISLLFSEPISVAPNYRDIPSLFFSPANSPISLPFYTTCSSSFFLWNLTQVVSWQSSHNWLGWHSPSGLNRIELLICGQIYIVDLANFAQFRRDIPGRVRRIKRDLVTAQAIGVAGLVSSSWSCRVENSSSR